MIQAAAHTGIERSHHRRAFEAVRPGVFSGAMIAKPSRRDFVLGSCATAAASGCATRASGGGGGRSGASLVVYFGTYTPKDGASRGIYRATLDTASGALSQATLAAETAHPSYLAIAPDGRHLYAVNELVTSQGEPAGAVQAFTIDPGTHDLTPGNQLSTGGGSPCHLTLDRTGKALVVANYLSGSVASFPLRPDGSIGPRASLIQHQGKSAHATRQAGPHAHIAMLDPAGKRVFVCDLGIDRVLAYTVDANGALTGSATPAGTLAPGSGPRHIAFHPSGRFAYVNNELSSTVTAFTHDPDTGALTELHTLSTLPGEHPGNSTAHVLLTPDGRWLYVSNRGHDSLAMYAVDQATGRLTAQGHQPTGGKIPRDFSIDPGGAFLLAAHQKSDNVMVFRIEPSTGRLTPVGAPVTVPSSVCVVFLRAS